MDNVKSWIDCRVEFARQSSAYEGHAEYLMDVAILCDELARLGVPQPGYVQEDDYPVCIVWGASSFENSSKCRTISVSIDTDKKASVERVSGEYVDGPPQEFEWDDLHPLAAHLIAEISCYLPTPSQPTDSPHA